MSVPVRYSAAANYAVVENCGLSNTLQQEEQYHQYQLQQQKLQQQQEQLYCQFVADANTNTIQQANNNSECSNNNYVVVNNGNFVNGFDVQQQLMQQRSSMSSSVSPATGLLHNATNNNNTNLQQRRSSLKNNNNMDNININNVHLLREDEDAEAAEYLLHNSLMSAGGACGDDDDVGVMTSAAAVAAAVEAANENGSVAMHAVDEDLDVDEWNMSDEGRYGTPGAAGLDYQKYELEQQQLKQQQTPANMLNQPIMESSLMDNENRNMKLNMNSKMNNNSQNTTNNTIKNNNDASSNATETTKSKEDELSALSSDELYRMLNEYNVLQDKYHTVLLLPRESKREVTAGGRDGSAYVLRCLKMWYELPSDVLFSAMSLVDRFLDRMAVKPKHMACMSVASFHLAIKQLGLKPIPAEELVTISQCGCTAGDLERMAGVIANKLGVQMGTKPVTAVTILRVFYALFRNLAKEVCDEFYEFFLRMIKLEDLENRLENLLCDVKTTVVTPSTLALILICLHMDFHIKASYKRERPELKPVFEYILFLQQYLRIPDRVFSCGFTIVADILSHYNGQNKQPYKQRLVWKLSSRTMKVLRPTNRFSTDLTTIDEGQVNVMDDGCRSRTESISSEEEEDWPTSPIIPIFEQC